MQNCKDGTYKRIEKKIIGKATLWSVTIMMSSTRLSLRHYLAQHFASADMPNGDDSDVIDREQECNVRGCLSGTRDRLPVYLGRLFSDVISYQNAS